MPVWSRRDPSPARPAPAAPRAIDPTPEFFDALESRLALYSSPFLAHLPTLELMEHSENTVVRMQTTAGIVDIELYNRSGPGTAPGAPNTAANFLRYINDGRLDNTFFHRLAEGFVLQGGGFTFNAATSKSVQVPTFPPVVNEFNAGRSNIARTIAMAKLGDQPDSATSQFFFNLVNNAANLDNQNGGFTVFGKVIQGWEIITDISNFQTRNLNQFLTGNTAGAFDAVPLSGSANTDLVSIIDVEVIKPANQDFFYAHSVYFPDGFRSGNTTQSVEVVNLDDNASSVYQIIARYEGGSRDEVIASGILTPGARASVQVSKARTPSINLVRGGVPFAYEVRSTQALAASVNHADFGATAGEAFVAAEPLATGNLRNWSFANGIKGPGLASYITYQNLSDQTASVTAVFYSENGTTFLITKTLEPYRRGGLDVMQLPAVTNGLYSVRLLSDQPIVSALSQYRAAPGRAATQTGQVGGAAAEGILPAAIIPTTGQSILSVLYTGDTPTTVTIDFSFILSDGTVLTPSSDFTLSTTQRRRELDLSIANGAIPRGQFFTIRYKVRNAGARVTAAVTTVVSGDTITTPFQSNSGAEIAFADGFTDPSEGATGSEVLSLYNPFVDPTVSLDYRISIHFVDNPQDEIIIPLTGTGTLGAGDRVDIPIRTLTDAMTKIGSEERFRHYSIRVVSSATRAASPIDGAIFAQLNRFDSAGNTISTGPTLAPETFAMFVNDPRLLGPI